MNNFNKEQKCYCQYCNKECKSLNSLKNHEIRCKENPNKLPIKGFNEHQFDNSNRIFINKNGQLKHIKKDKLEEYINDGWILGYTEEYKQKISNSLKGKSTGKASTYEKELERKRKISETMKKNPQAGGYRKGSGVGKQGWYKDIFCDSSWELSFVCYYKEHNLNIQRCQEHRNYIFNNEEHVYIPDFVTDDGIIEIKGYKSKQWNAKIEQNPDIKVLYYKDVKMYLDYVISKYGNKFWEILYDKK